MTVDQWRALPQDEARKVWRKVWDRADEDTRKALDVESRAALRAPWAQQPVLARCLEDADER